MEWNRYKATVLYLVPTMVQQLLVHPMINNIDFSSVLTFICIGGHLPRESRIKLVSLPQQAQQAVQFAEGKECFGLGQRGLKLSLPYSFQDMACLSVYAKCFRADLQSLKYSGSPAAPCSNLNRENWMGEVKKI